MPANNRFSTWLSNTFNGYSKDADGNLIAPGTEIAINDRGQLIDTSTDGSAFENLTQEQLDSVAQLAQDQMTSRYEDNQAERERLQEQYDASREQLEKAALDGSVSVDELDRLADNRADLEKQLQDNLDHNQEILQTHATVTNAINNVATDYDLENTYEDTNDKLKSDDTGAYASDQLNHAADNEGDALKLDKLEQQRDELDKERAISNQGLDSVNELLSQERAIDGSILTDEDKKNGKASIQVKDLDENARVQFTNPETNETSYYSVKELENLQDSYKNHLDSTEEDLDNYKEQIERAKNADTKDPNRVEGVNDPNKDEATQAQNIESHNDKNFDKFSEQKLDQRLQLAQDNVDDYKGYLDDIRNERKKLNDKGNEFQKGIDKFEKEQEKIENNFDDKKGDSKYIVTKSIDKDEKRSLKKLDNEYTYTIDGRKYNIDELKALQKNNDKAIEDNKDSESAVGKKLEEAKRDLNKIQRDDASNDNEKNGEKNNGKDGNNGQENNGNDGNDASDKDGNKDGDEATQSGDLTAAEAIKTLDGQAFMDADQATRQEMVKDLQNQMSPDEFSKFLDGSANVNVDPETAEALKESIGEIDATEQTETSEGENNVSSVASTDDNEVSNDESEASNDESEASNDESEASNDESEASNDDNEASNDETEASNDETEASNDESEASEDKSGDKKPKLQDAVDKASGKGEEEAEASQVNYGSPLANNVNSLVAIAKASGTAATKEPDSDTTTTEDTQQEASEQAAKDTEAKTKNAKSKGDDGKGK